MQACNRNDEITLHIKIEGCARLEHVPPFPQRKDLFNMKEEL